LVLPFVIVLVLLLVLAGWTIPARKIEHEQEHDYEAIESMLPS